MSCHSRVTEWTTIIRLYLPHLSKPQATVLALWSLGMVLARSCALTAVATFLAVWLRRGDGRCGNSWEFCYEAEAKRGDQRQALCVECCFVPLLAWVLSRWQGTQLALALDATTLGLRFTVLAISVVYRGCAIPVAWTILPANTNHAWRREWLRLLRQLRPAIPRDWTVIVLADRGLYAGWLFRRIVRLGLAPIFADQPRGDLSPGPAGRLPPVAQLRRADRDTLARHGHRVQKPPTAPAVYPARLLGGGLYRPLAHPDRSAARGQRCRLVWAAGLDRARLQSHQTRGLAVAAHAHDRPTAGRPLVAGGGGRHPVAAERRGRRQGNDSQDNPARCHGHPEHAATAAARHPSAPGQYLPPGLGPDPGGFAPPAASSRWARFSQSLGPRSPRLIRT